MKRVPEPEVMDDPGQALAYARADFADVNQAFVDSLLARAPRLRGARVLDIGCGPADIPLRLTAAAPATRVVGVDASAPMLELARRSIAGRDRGRIALVCARLPALPVPPAAFDVVISNSLLHHLPDPLALWRELARVGRPGAVVHVMDLFRPDSVAEARAIVARGAGGEDPLLQRDFFNSLLAAFTPDEVRAQLAGADLRQLTCTVASDRHLLVAGTL